MENEQRKMDRFDWTLAFLLFLFFVVSCLAISSAQTTSPYEVNFVKQQVFWYVVGSIIIAGCMLFEPEQYKKLSWYLYGFGIFLLLFLKIAPETIAPYTNGVKSWFRFGGVGFQPSEFMKIFMILAMGRLIVDHHQKYLMKTLKTDFLLFAKIALTALVPLALVLDQPDLGTGLVLMAITAGILLVSGISWKIIIPMFLSVGLIGAGIIYVMIQVPEYLKAHIPDYQFKRIYSWLDPYSYPTKEGFNLISAMQAIGSGEITGKGYLDREVNVPENHTDFIFTVIGEEYGFIGASIVIILYFLLIFHIIRTALETNSHFNAYVCAGIISMTAFHVFENIGMSIQLLPITGIPLPFISYGGSSLMGNMFAMGIIFSIRYYHRNYMFATEDEEE